MKVFVSTLLLLALAVPAFGSTPLPEPVGFVNDFANVISAETEASIAQTLTVFQASTTNEVAVVTISSLGGDYIESYAENLFEKWGIGDEEKDNGILLLLAIEDRALRIEIGYGLEGVLTDSEAKAIMDQMTPYLQDADYDGAVSFAVQGIIDATEGDGSTGSPQGTGVLSGDAIVGIIFLGFTVLAWLVAILARTKSVWVGGVVGAAAGIGVSSVFAWWLMGGLLATAVFVVVGLLFDWAVSSAYSEAKRSGTTPPWWAGGATGFGGSSSGGSFGGFGGGSSGGGGASGSW